MKKKKLAAAFLAAVIVFAVGASAEQPAAVRLPSFVASLPGVGGTTVLMQVDEAVRCILWVGDKPGMGPPPSELACWSFNPKKVGPAELEAQIVPPLFPVRRDQ